MDIALKYLQKLTCHKIQTNNKTNKYHLNLMFVIIFFADCNSLLGR